MSMSTEPSSQPARGSASAGADTGLCFASLSLEIGPAASNLRQEGLRRRGPLAKADPNASALNEGCTLDLGPPALIVFGSLRVSPQLPRKPSDIRFQGRRRGCRGLRAAL